MEVLLIVWLIGWLGPVALVGYIATRRGYSRHYMWWPVALGWIGGIVALAILLLKPERVAAG